MINPETKCGLQLQIIIDSFMHSMQLVQDEEMKIKNAANTQQLNKRCKKFKISDPKIILCTN